MSLTNYNVDQQENCSTALGLQSQSYDRYNWCSLPEAQLGHHGRQIFFELTATGTNISDRYDGASPFSAL